MYVELKDYKDYWQEIKDTTMTTVGKSKGSYPKNSWKKGLLMSEHSPIRKGKINWKWHDLKYYVSVHFVRHKFGIEHFVSTQRTDRTGVLRDNLTQDALVSHECEADFQALINISRRRLCNCASAETILAWKALKEEISKVEPELSSCMVRECVYRGFCPEMKSCGFVKTEDFKKELEAYRNGYQSVQK